MDFCCLENRKIFLPLRMNRNYLTEIDRSICSVKASETLIFTGKEGLEPTDLRRPHLKVRILVSLLRVLKFWVLFFCSGKPVFSIAIYCVVFFFAL